MENSLEKKSHPCKSCIISMICVDPCEKYYPDICVLDKMVEYKRAIYFSLSQQHKIIIRINKNECIHIFNANIQFFKNETLHRDGDKPTIIYIDGTKKYYKKGKCHRSGDKPAMIYPDGTKYYYRYGLIHRDKNKPAIIHSNGSKEYWEYGKFIRGEWPSM